MKERVGWLGIFTVLAVVAASLVGVWAFGRLGVEGKGSFYGDVARLSYQAVVIVALGVLAKRALDDAADRRKDAERRVGAEKREAELRIMRRSEYVRRLIDDSHVVDRARMLVRANRSVLTWSNQMDNVIDAYVDLRDVRHDIATSEVAGDPVFADWGKIQEGVGDMEEYLGRLTDEYVQQKKPLSELQRLAEADRDIQEVVWQRLSGLAWLGDLIENGEQFGGFRRGYAAALAEMRRQLADTPPADR